MSDPLDRLCRESGLDRDDVAFLAGLDEDQLTGLLEAYRHASAKRRRDLAEAIDNGLKVVPFLLRPAVKKMLS